MSLKKLLYLLLVVHCGFCYAQNNCGSFKNGTFTFTDNNKRNYIITRDGNKQTEKIKDEQEVYDFTIKWTDSCTYTVTPTAATIKKNKAILKLGTMTVKITPKTDTSYVQLVRVANSPKFKRRDEVFVVNDNN